VSRRRASHATLPLLLLASCSGYLKPPEPQRGLALTEKMSHFSASNGFRVFVLPDEQAPVVRLELRYEVGAIDDPPGKEGMAHLIEHLMFQTRLSKESGTVTVASELSRVAQTWNARTTLDSTHYMAQALPEKLPVLFAIEMNRLASGCATWDEVTFLREREVVRNEMRERHATAATEIRSLLHQAVYPAGHPYRRDVGGSDESIARIQLGDVCAFMAQHHQPSKVSIFAVGATDDAAVHALASTWLTQFPGRPAARAPAVPPIANGHRRVVTYDLDIDEPQVFALFPLPAEGTLESRVAEMLYPPELLLGSLAATYRFGHGAASDTIGGARAPVLAVTLTVRDLGHIDEALDGIWKSVERSRRESGHEVNPIAWMWYREHQKEAILSRFEPLDERASNLADYVQFGATGFMVERLRELDRIDAADLRRTAQAILDPDRATVVVFRPRPGARHLTAGAFKYQPEADDTGHWKHIVDPAEADRPVPLPAQRKRVPPIQRYALPNGLRVILWPHASLPLVHARLVIAAGLSDEPPGQVGAAAVAAAGGVVTQDTTLFAARDLATELHTTLERLSKRLRLHRTQDLQDAREELQRALRQPRAAARTRYELALRAATFGAAHPYARGLLTEAEVAGIAGDAVAGFQRGHYTAGDSALVLTGKFDPALVRDHIVYQFGHLGEHRARRPPIPPAAPPAGPRLVAGAGEPGSPVVEINIRVAGAPGVGPGYAARRVLERVLDAELRELREHQAVTYGMYAHYDVRRGPGEWRMGGAADAARAAEAMSFILDRLDRMRRDPMTYRADFVLARRAVVEELLTRGTSGAEMADSLMMIAEHDLPDDFADRLVEEVARVTPADVHRLLRAEINPARVAIGAFGPPAAVEQVLAAARAWRTGQRASGAATASRRSCSSDSVPVKRRCTWTTEPSRDHAPFSHFFR
jgi:zinc protease